MCVCVCVLSCDTDRRISRILYSIHAGGYARAHGNNNATAAGILAADRAVPKVGNIALLPGRPFRYRAALL